MTPPTRPLGLRLREKVQRALGAIAAGAYRRPARTLGAVAVLAVLAALPVRRLGLDADLSALLPRSFESVRALEEVRRRFGGIGYVTVVAHDASPEALRRFADDVAPKLEALPGIRDVEYMRPTSFFEDRALYYASLEDLRRLRETLDARIAWEKRRAQPLFVPLSDDEAPEVDTRGLEAKVGARFSSRLGGSEPYYLDPKTRTVVLLARPDAPSLDLGAARRVIAEVEGVLAGVDRARYGPDFGIQITGTYKKKIDQQEQITRDLSVASAVAGLLLVLYLWIHFRSPVAVLVNLAPVGFGLLLTYGAVAAWQGSVNLLTGFLAAILGGLGIEHGIHLLGRYGALRGRGVDGQTAIRETMAESGAAALTSALVAALTFATLSLSAFRAFREFGVIAAVGMMLILFAYVVVLPASLAIAERLGFRAASTRVVGARTVKLTRVMSEPGVRRVVAVASVVALGVLAVTATRVGFDYDFRSLEDARLPSFVFDVRANAVIGRSQSPIVVLTPGEAAERHVVNELVARKQARGAASTIDFVAAASDLVPSDQAAKRRELEAIGKLVEDVDPDTVSNDDTRRKLERLARLAKAAPFAADDVPRSVRRQFETRGGEPGSAVLVFPGVSLADGMRVRALAREVRGLRGPDGRPLPAAGEPLILADVIDMVSAETPRVLAAALIGVLLAMLLSLGRLRDALTCLAPTLASILALVGVMPIVRTPFNYLNIIVLPVLVGVTVDAGVHLVTRLRSADGEPTLALAETGRAIRGGLLTSAVGFGAMMFAEHPGLRSIGLLANLGLAVNAIVVLLVFPALVLPLYSNGRAVSPARRSP